MTKLQSELLDAIQKAGSIATPFGYATACDEVAKRYIEKALNDTGSIFDEQQKKDWANGWMKENGVIE